MGKRIAEVNYLDCNSLSIKNCQEKDHFCGPILAYLTEGILPSEAKEKTKLLATIEHYTIDKEYGLLFKLYLPSRFKSKNIYTQLVVPAVLENKVLQIYHDSSILGGHSDVKRTFSKIVQAFYFEGMFNKVAEYIQTCTRCQKRRILRHPLLPPIHPVQASYIFECCELDHIGPIVSSKPELRNPRGHKYILTCVCMFSKYVVAVPVRDYGPETTVKKIFSQILLKFGMVKRFITDRGSAFISTILSELTRVLQIEHAFAASANPQANGGGRANERSYQECHESYCR